MITIDIENLSKTYRLGFKRITAIKNMNIHLDNNRCVFLVGANGNGKTTLIKCILNLVKYDGKIIINTKKIAYAPEKIQFPDYIRVEEFLFDLAKCKKKSNLNYRDLIEDFINKFSLNEHRNKYLIKLSKGTKQKINLIQALLSDADVYIFDEPLSGLDEKSKNTFVREIQNLRKHSKLIIIATHHPLEYHFRVKTIVEIGMKDKV